MDCLPAVAADKLEVGLLVALQPQRVPAQAKRPTAHHLLPEEHVRNTTIMVP